MFPWRSVRYRALHGLPGGVAEAVLPHADDPHLRRHRLQQLLGGGVPAAVVARQEHLDVRQVVERRQLPLGGGVHVPGDEQVERPGGA